MQPIPSTPNQAQKIPLMNNTGNNYYNKTPLMNAKNGNLMMMENLNRPYGSSVGEYYQNKNGKTNEGMEQKQKKSIENYRKFLSKLEQNIPNQKP